MQNRDHLGERTAGVVLISAPWCRRVVQDESAFIDPLCDIEQIEPSLIQY